MTYEYKTWETINLPAVSGDTYYIIYDHTTATPGDDQTGIIYSGLILDGYGLKNIDEILSQYVNPMEISFDSSIFVDEHTHKYFYIYYTQDDWETYTSDTIIMTYDWSYSDSQRAALSDPIIDLLDSRQFFVYSIKPGTPDTTTTINVRLGNILVQSFQITGYNYYNYFRDLSNLTYPGEFTYAYSYDFFVDRSIPLDGVYELTIGSAKYYVTDTCYRYCVYYINQYGGWDSMLFRGRELQVDNLSRLSYKRNYVAQSQDFHKKDYLTNIAETWELNTSYINDVQSSKMINLLASNRMYLHDLETGNIVPVNVTNSNCEHKTYKNQGRKISAYTVNVAASQPKYRV